MKSSTPPSTSSINIVIQTAFLGDLLLAVPLLSWVRKLNPGVPLGLICRKGLGSTLLKLGIVDHFWEIEKGNRDSYKKIQEELKTFNINWLISAHTSFRTTLFCAGIRANRKITFAKPWNYFFFDERVGWDDRFPEALRLLSLLKNSSEEIKNLFSRLPSPQDFIQKDVKCLLSPPPAGTDSSSSFPAEEAFKNYEVLAEKFGLQNKKWIALFPGSVWATKMWKKSGYAELGQVLQKQGYQIVIMGGAPEKQLGKEVASQIPQAINLCGETSLYDSIILLSQAKLVVGNDSSSSHMAALVGVPVVSIFGPTVLKFGYRPWAHKTAIVEFENLSCRPCGPHGHQKCPLGHHHCMEKLEVSKVLKTVENLLGS